MVRGRRLSWARCHPVHGPGCSDLSEPSLASRAAREGESSRGGGGAARTPTARVTALSNAEAIVAGGERGGEGRKGRAGMACPYCPRCPGPALPGGPASLSISRPSRSAYNPQSAIRQCHAWPPSHRGQKAGMGRAERESRWMHHPSVFTLPLSPHSQSQLWTSIVHEVHTRPSWSACWRTRRVTGCRLRLGISTIGQPPCNRPLLASLASLANKGERDCIPASRSNSSAPPKTCPACPAQPSQPSPTLPSLPRLLAELACPAKPYQMAIVAIAYDRDGQLVRTEPAWNLLGLRLVSLPASPLARPHSLDSLACPLHPK